MGRILLVRHGQASLMEDDYDRLSPLGHKQGEVAGRWLAARLGTPQLVVTGTLQRQRDTSAACIAAAGWDAVQASRTSPSVRGSSDSARIFTMALAARRRANGSFDPVGEFPIPNMAVMV